MLRKQIVKEQAVVWLYHHLHRRASSLHRMISVSRTIWSFRRDYVPLVPSLEWVEIPGDLAATLRCRSSYGRRGVIISAGFVDPGFRGQLTLCLINMGNDDIALKKNDRIVQMIIHEVRDGGTLYSGRYQDSLWGDRCAMTE